MEPFGNVREVRKNAETRRRVKQRMETSLGRRDACSSRFLRQPRADRKPRPFSPVRRAPAHPLLEPSLKWLLPHAPFQNAAQLKRCSRKTHATSLLVGFEQGLESHL